MADVTVPIRNLLWSLNRAIDSMQDRSWEEKSDTATTILRALAACPRPEWVTEPHHGDKLATVRVWDRMFRELMHQEPADFETWAVKRVSILWPVDKK